MKKISDGSIDMVLTSPPYDNLRTYNGSLEWGEHIWKPVIQELFRLIKDGGVVVWVVGDATIKGSETGTSFKQALYFKEIGFNLHDTMIYAKNNPVILTHNRYEQQFEYTFIFSKGKPKTFNPILIKNKTAGSKKSWKRTTSYYEVENMANRSRDEITIVKEKRIDNNIRFYNIGNKTGHPASFPEKLAEDHIISWSNEGDTILDPFAGSGTTGKMAKQLNRNCILIERELEYVEIAKKRINETMI
jgi:site-specific DNA-methyltransferase (adenine-specific)